MAPMAPKLHELYVPATFYDDHADRAPNGYDHVPVEIGRRGNRVLVRATDAQLMTLQSDAEFYADPDSMDECPSCYVRSAKRTLRAILKHLRYPGTA